MGRNKALLVYQGLPLAEFLALQMDAVCEPVTLIGDPEELAPLGRPVIPDLEPGLGPLGGMWTALAHTQAEWNLILACDLPSVRSPFLRQLAEEALRRGATCLVPLDGQGEPQPLCAVYHRRALAATAAAVNRRQLKVRHLLRDIEVVTWPAPDSSALVNVNTPEDWATHVGGDLTLHRVPPSQ
jgi:molybdopterin-guanine dinucleotide biosynthesis protein A